ncbi:hypothetical protein CcCBS67573_g06046 [Chytriomyces confervae]|uniref:Cytochrome c oxidase assembly factor 5 n=1 Tax=Chytriomyces confervae TaxID=246404 RepID=A0A507F9D1_9FUNG|nr:Dephospho-CoA kinase (Dephosphocoenzyme A kinase) (COAE) [Chytriomyces hyalinus]TPX71946.1 hypothetical protein CcCBS67573_g06046 [Chytriomyces confervae]
MPSCERFKIAVLDCLRASDCVAKNGKSVNECLNLKNKDVDQECRLAQRAFFECQLAMLNPRRRMRGPYGGVSGSTHPENSSDQTPASKSE